jgi:hypothetical protein
MIKIVSKELRLKIKMFSIRVGDICQCREERSRAFFLLSLKYLGVCLCCLLNIEDIMNLLVGWTIFFKFASVCYVVRIVGFVQEKTKIKIFLFFFRFHDCHANSSDISYSVLYKNLRG